MSIIIKKRVFPEMPTKAGRKVTRVHQVFNTKPGNLFKAIKALRSLRKVMGAAEGPAATCWLEIDDVCIHDLDLFWVVKRNRPDSSSWDATCMELARQLIAGVQADCYLPLMYWD